MSPSHSEMIGRPYIEMFGRSASSGSPDLVTARSRSSSTNTMVDQWLETHSSQTSSYVSQSSVRSSSSKTSRDSKSSMSSTLGKKQVRWASNLEDYNDYPHLQDAKSTQRDEKKPILSKTKRRMKYPPVPEPPRTRGPPPAPRPRRLPTPELPDLDHGEFCSCCSESFRKMNAQMAAATQHIAKHSVRY